MGPGHERLSCDERLNDEEARKYRCIVGTLLYLAIKTRPDLADTERKLVLHIASPMNSDMTVAKRALRFCQGAKQMSLYLLPDADNHLKAKLTKIGCGTKRMIDAVVPVYLFSSATHPFMAAVSYEIV